MKFCGYSVHSYKNYVNRYCVKSGFPLNYLWNNTLQKLQAFAFSTCIDYIQYTITLQKDIGICPILVPICTEWWCTEANGATQTHCYNIVAPAYPIWAYYAHGWQCRCQEDPVSLPQAPTDWRKPGRPRISLLITVQQDLKRHHFTLPESADLAQNCPLWRMMSTYGATQPWVARQKRRRQRIINLINSELYIFFPKCDKN